MRVEPRQLSENERSGASELERIIAVYVCPKCNNYFGSSNMGFLEDQKVIAPPEAKDGGKLRFYRNRCPVCHTPRERRFARLVSKEEERETRNSLR